VTGAAISTTTAGVIALVVGVLLSWKKDAPRTRLALLVGGSTSVTAGMFGKVTGQAADTVSSVSTAATTAVFGSAVGIVGLILLTWLIVRDALKGGMSRWTDLAAVVTPPLASSFGGMVWALCLLVAGIVAWGITGIWEVAGSAAGMVFGQIGGGQ